MNIDELRKIPLADFLARLGHEPVRRSGNELWYLAPYRGERTPSFRVNVAKQLWYDFGLGKGGDIFTLACEFLQSDDFMAQARFIAEAANMTVAGWEKPTYLPKPAEPVFEDVEVAPFAQLSADGVSCGTVHPLRHRIPPLLPPKLRCAWETVFCHRFPEHGRGL